MFEQFYEFEQTPFSRDIPVEHLYRVAGQEEVLSRLVYAAKMRWFAVLTGECGSGKSTIIRSLKETLDGRGYRCMYIADSSLSPRHFYNGILSQLGVEGKFYRGDSKRILQRELEVLAVLQHVTPVIIVDEAHLLYRTARNLMFISRILIGLNKEQASNHLTEIQSNCLMLVLY